MYTCESILDRVNNCHIREAFRDESYKHAHIKKSKIQMEERPHVTHMRNKKTSKHCTFPSTEMHQSLWRAVVSKYSSVNSTNLLKKYNENRMIDTTYSNFLRNLTMETAKRMLFFIPALPCNEMNESQEKLSSNLQGNSRSELTG